VPDPIVARHRTLKTVLVIQRKGSGIMRCIRKLPPIAMVVLLFGLSCVDLAIAGEGEDLARGWSEFGHELAHRNLSFSDDLAEMLDSHSGGGTCTPDKKAADALSASELELLNLYEAGVCRPSVVMWLSAHRKCQQQPPPSWCGDDETIAGHIDVDGFFGALSSYIRSAKNAMAVETLMYAAVGTLSAHGATRFPESSLDRWAGMVMRAYVERADAEGVLKYAQLLSDSWVEQSRQTSDVLSTYARGAKNITVDQREAILALAKKFAGEPK
jgi:hypothetical protein